MFPANYFILFLSFNYFFLVIFPPNFIGHQFQMYVVVEIPWYHFGWVLQEAAMQPSPLPIANLFIIVSVELLVYGQRPSTSYVHCV